MISTATPTAGGGLYSAGTSVRETEEWFQSFFNFSPVCMAIHAPDNRWCDVNGELCNLLGYTKDEVLERNWTAFLHPEDILRYRQLVEKLEKGIFNHFTMETRYLHRSGSVLYVNFSQVCLRKDDGSIFSYLTSMVNETHCRMAAEKINRDKNTLRTLVDHLPFPVYVLDAEGRKVVSNLADQNLTGCADESSVLGKTDLELYAGQTGLRGHTDTMAVLKTGKPILGKEELFILPDGSSKYLDTTKIPLLNKDNTATGLVGIGLDVTVQRQMQRQVEESEVYFRSLFNLSPDGIFVSDVRGIIEKVSRKGCEILGYPDTHDLLGESVFNWIHPEDQEEAKAAFHRIVINPEPEPRRIFRCLKSDQSVVFVELTTSHLRHLPDGELRILIFCRDITDRIHAEEELLKTKKQAEESNRLKTAFLQNLSHEIRTPMNGIMGFVEILRDPSYSPEQQEEFKQIVQQSGKRLMGTINDLIEISRIMTGDVPVCYEDVAVQSFFYECYLSYAESFNQKKISLQLNRKLTMPVILRTDKNKIAVVLQRLMDNALKFTEAGGDVELGYYLQGNQFVFYLKDTGIGMHPEETQRIFEVFNQLEQGMNRRFEGSGLGLAIARSYMELLGGGIRAESRPGEGSIFTCVLPYEPQTSIEF